MKGMTMEKMAEVCNGQLFLNDNEKINKEAVSVVIDSRKAQKDGVFVATKGSRVDGHDFIKSMFELGVLCVICEKEPEIKNGNYILVEDSFIAIKKLAKYYRSQLSLKIIGIIGSVGKTSTKEIVSSVVSRKYNTVKTIGNFNNEVGVPLTIFSIRDEHEVAVVEMGISDFGEMDRLGDIVKPDLCVMTNIGPCHLEALHDLDGVLQAKTEVFNHMNKGSLAILNGDDEKLRTVKSKNGIDVYFYGKSKANYVFATDIVPMEFEGTQVKIHTQIGDFDVRIPIPGEHMVDNCLAATIVGIKLNLSLEEIKQGIEAATTIAGRSNVIKTDKIRIVDDCYNANPKSMMAAIDLLSQVKGRKVALLGDMFELGDDEIELHTKIGEYISDKIVDVLILAGDLSKNIFDKVVELGKIKEVYYKEKTEEVIELLSSKEILKPEDTVLIKASHGMNYAKIVEYLRNY